MLSFQDMELNLSHVQEEEKLIEAELTSIKEQVSSPHASMVWFYRFSCPTNHNILRFNIHINVYIALKLLRRFISSCRGRWRSSWLEQSTVKCSATTPRLPIFTLSNWLNKAVLWKKEWVCYFEYCLKNINILLHHLVKVFREVMLCSLQVILLCLCFWMKVMSCCFCLWTLY